MSDESLSGRSIRTLAWLGDAEYEREVRRRIARRGDWPTATLDRVRARVTCAEAQAAMLELVEAELHEAELDTVRRARNAQLRGRGRGVRDVQAYRAATGLEALVAHWALAGDDRWQRFEQLLAPQLEQAIDRALVDAQRRPPPDR